MANGYLAQLIIDLKAWREGWEDILKLQHDAVDAFVYLYKPIEPTDDPEMTRVPNVTPQSYMQKCQALQNLYADVRADLAREIGLISTQLQHPAEEAKKCTKALHKTLKHRENMKRDYERYLGRVEHVRRKDNRSMKEETALAKHENDLTQAQIDYNTADEQVKQTFPPVTDEVIKLIPMLLTAQVMLQTTLVGQLYTVLSAYNKKQGLPGPEVTDGQIVASWEHEFTGFRKELESEMKTLSNGKAVRMAMTLPPEKDGSTLTGLGIRNKVMSRKPGAGANIPPKRPSAGLIEDRQDSQLQIANSAYEEEEQAPPKPPRPSAPTSPMPFSSPTIPTSSKPRIPSSVQSPTPTSYEQYPSSLTPHYPQSPPTYEQSASTPPSRYQTPQNGQPSPMGLLSTISNTNARNGDYFDSATARRPSAASSTVSSSAASIAAKKKPPPPVPVKRIASAAATVPYVTALYDFEGQNEGDLVFREGDRIRVVMRTGSTDDWWEGELRGRVGVFPANYVKD